MTTKAQLKELRRVQRGIRAELHRRAGLRMTERAAEDAEGFASWSMVEMAREMVRDSFRGPSNLDAVRIAVSTAGLGSILSEVVNKKIVQVFNEAHDSTRGWCVETDVPNFKTNTSGMVGKIGTLSPLERGGEADHSYIAGGAETHKIARYAGQLVVDEQDIIDDDAGALGRVPAEMGAAAARLRPDLVYSELLANAALGADSVALFHADHDNLLTGASSALNGTSLQSAISLMAKQKKDGVDLNVRPAYLIVPPELRFVGSQLLHSAETRQPNATGEHGTRNVIAGENLILASDNRISAAGVTNPATGTVYTGSATNWFLAGDARTTPTIEVGYRDGTGRKPMVRSFELSQGQWGIGWDVQMDIGVKALAHQGLARSDGA